MLTEKALRRQLASSSISILAVLAALATSSAGTLRSEPLTVGLLIIALAPWLYRLVRLWRRNRSTLVPDEPPALPASVEPEEVDDQVRLRVKINILKITNETLAEWAEDQVRENTERLRWMASRKDTFKWIAAFSAAGLFGVAQLTEQAVSSGQSWLSFALGCFFVSLVAGVLFTTRVDLRNVYDGYKVAGLYAEGARLSRETAKWIDLIIAHYGDDPDDKLDYVAEYRRVIDKMRDYLQRREAASYLPPNIRVETEGYWLGNACATFFLGGAFYVLGFALVRLLVR